MEYRNLKWFEDDWYNWAESQKITLVSIDSPDFPNRILNVNGLVYLRMHSRTSWYSHRYNYEELKEIASRIRNADPKKVYVFFNNNHNMLEERAKHERYLKLAHYFSLQVSLIHLNSIIISPSSIRVFNAQKASSKDSILFHSPITMQVSLDSRMISDRTFYQ